MPAICEGSSLHNSTLHDLSDDELQAVVVRLPASYQERMMVYLSHYVDLDEWYPERHPSCVLMLSNGEPGDRELIEIKGNGITWTYDFDSEPLVEEARFPDLISKFVTRRDNGDADSQREARLIYERWIESAALGIDIDFSNAATLGQFFDKQFEESNVVPFSFSRNTDKEASDREVGWNALQDAIARVKEMRDTLPDANGFPAHCLCVPGLVGEIASWINRSAITPQPVFALMNSVAAIGTLAGRRYAFDGEDTRSNVYLLAIGKTGVGKDHSRKQIKKLFTAAGLSRMLMGDDVHSRSGLLSALQSHPVKLCHMDEFGKKLEAMASKADTTAKSITRGLLELTGAANGVLLGDEYADRKAKPREDLYEPHLSLFATTTPETLTAALSSVDTVSGLLNRFVLGETSNSYPDRCRPIDLEPPASLVEAIKSSHASAPEGSGNLQGVVTAHSVVNQLKITVRATAEGQSLIDAAYEEQRKHLLADGSTAPLWARYRELVIKFSMIRAIGINPAQPVIAEDDARWACDLVRASTIYAAQLVSRHVADNEIERFSKKLLELIRKAGANGVTKSYITTHTRGTPKRVREDAISDLQEAGLLAMELRSTATKPGMYYWAR